MPLNDIIKEVSRKTGPHDPEGNAPSAAEAGMPEGEPSPTTMDTPEGLAPWIHNQLVNERSLLAMAGGVLVLLELIDLLEEHVL